MKTWGILQNSKSNCIFGLFILDVFLLCYWNMIFGELDPVDMTQFELQ